MRYCRGFRRYLERARVGLMAYERIAKPLIGAPGWRERDPPGSAYIDCDTVCRIVEMLRDAVAGGVCIVGPGVNRGVPGWCPEVAGPSPAVASTGGRLLYVTSDLDSRPLLEQLSALAARVFLVHVHSDNHARLSMVRGLPAGGWIVYTGQECSPWLMPMGGFTDGDRAIVLAMSLGAPWVRVMGFTGAPVAWHKEYPLFKGWKLSVAGRIVYEVARGLRYRVVPVTGGWVLEAR
ncbi:MAG: hypothetical protein GSR78_04160 [Desulfurococcales archaeon]|nr:hypothetical protein [Desulfurococcales archaeon]